MSMKDDFLEALRSVKKDLFKEYEYAEVKPEPEPVPEPEPDFSQIFTPHDDGPALPYQAAGGDEPGAGAFAGDLHSARGGEDEEDFAPDVDPTPFRTANDVDEMRMSAGNGNDNDNGNDGGEPPRDGRVIFDEGGGAYGDDRTIISKNTVIRGALQTEDSVRMFGQILGDIDCKSNILVAGKVRGNTSAANAYVIDAQVDGNLLCDDVINITDDAWILGNIRAQQAEIDGKIKGNIEIRHTISIGANSSVIGNISTDELEIKRGAFVNGQIMMYSPSRDVIDRFDQFEK